MDEDPIELAAELEIEAEAHDVRQMSAPTVVARLLRRASRALADAPRRPPRPLPVDDPERR